MERKYKRRNFCIPASGEAGHPRNSVVFYTKTAFEKRSSLLYYTRRVT